MEIAPVRVVGATWAKGRARVENDEIVLDRGRAEEYEFKSPEDSGRMAFDLAALVEHVGDEREAKSFAGRHGLFGMGGMISRVVSAESCWEIGGEKLVGWHSSVLSIRRFGSQSVMSRLGKRRISYASLVMASRI